MAITYDEEYMYREAEVEYDPYYDDPEVETMEDRW